MSQEVYATSNSKNRAVVSKNRGSHNEPCMLPAWTAGAQKHSTSTLASSMCKLGVMPGCSQLQYHQKCGRISSRRALPDFDEVCRRHTWSLSCYSYTSIGSPASASQPLLALPLLHAFLTRDRLSSASKSSTACFSPWSFATAAMYFRRVVANTEETGAVLARGSERGKRIGRWK
jgi:hypothetical protein